MTEGLRPTGLEYALVRRRVTPGDPASTATLACLIRPKVSHGQGISSLANSREEKMTQANNENFQGIRLIRSIQKLAPPRRAGSARAPQNSSGNGDQARKGGWALLS
jgi:hypothetical protein